MRTISDYLWYLLICVYCIPYVLSKLVPRDQSVWIFGYNGGEGFTDNSKHLYLYTEAQCDHLRPIWITKERETAQELQNNDYEAYTTRSIKGIYYSLISSAVFVTHSLHDVAWWCTGGATVIRLDHGIPFKKNHWGHEQEVKEFDPFIGFMNRHVFWNYDFATTPSKNFISKTAESANVPPEDVLVTGLPRTDVFFDPCYDPFVGSGSIVRDHVQRVAADSKIVFYFRTWRDAGDSPQKHYELSSLNELLKQTDAYMLCVEHTNSDNNLSLEEYDRIIIISIEQDFYPALTFADVTVTDYSSLVFDYLLVDVPILYYQYDFDSFVSERGLYFDFEELPGIRTFTFNQFLEELEAVLVENEDPTAEERRTWRNLVYDGNLENSNENVAEEIRYKLR